MSSPGDSPHPKDTVRELLALILRLKQASADQLSRIESLEAEKADFIAKEEAQRLSSSLGQSAAAARSELENVRLKYEDELRQSHTETEQAKSKVARLKATLKESQSSDRDELLSLTRALETARARCDLLETSQKAAQDELADVVSRHQNVSSALNDVREKVSAFESHVGRAESDAAEVRSRIIALDGHLQRSQEREREVSAANTALRSALQEAKERLLATELSLQEGRRLQKEQERSDQSLRVVLDQILLRYRQNEAVEGERASSEGPPTTAQKAAEVALLRLTELNAAKAKELEALRSASDSFKRDVLGQHKAFQDRITLLEDEKRRISALQKTESAQFAADLANAATETTQNRLRISELEGTVKGVSRTADDLAARLSAAQMENQKAQSELSQLRLERDSLLKKNTAFSERLVGQNERIAKLTDVTESLLRRLKQKEDESFRLRMLLEEREEYSATATAAPAPAPAPPGALPRPPPSAQSEGAMAEIPASARRLPPTSALPTVVLPPPPPPPVQKTSLVPESPIEPAIARQRLPAATVATFPVLSDPSRASFHSGQPPPRRVNGLIPPPPPAVVSSAAASAAIPTARPTTASSLCGICQKRASGLMRRCVRCRRRFHVACVGADGAGADDAMGYVCRSCRPPEEEEEEDDELAGFGAWRRRSGASSSGASGADSESGRKRKVGSVGMAQGGREPRKRRRKKKVPVKRLSFNLGGSGRRRQ